MYGLGAWLHSTGDTEYAAISRHACVVRAVENNKQWPFHACTSWWDRRGSECARALPGSKGGMDRGRTNNTHPHKPATHFHQLRPLFHKHGALCRQCDCASMHALMHFSTANVVFSKCDLSHRCTRPTLAGCPGTVKALTTCVLVRRHKHLLTQLDQSHLAHGAIPASPTEVLLGDIVWWGLNFQCLMMTSEFRFGWLLREV